ncbi:D-3-phosphoglycerate dehydrogenase [Paraburkholderia bannensis]|uniref:D-3-phosphoglycerate dehydrogenase n=1 Tax=Paraburkholderia bannensis TaxID=765414 RepID=A0A7W9U339_9BURK|nr:MULTISPECIES: hydroxyacid dehydrogenase [Paraburkholderia]MBB3261092.1 D-3-phosphoglycerate dehydrogenase [Paraburkholderia sp. WP4_3_2]MBB6106129.1 D-3-phosphoglycerate dehydrogenase [Paraburkholderia bannensis]
MNAATPKPSLIVTGNDLAPDALQMLRDFEIVFAGRTPTESDLIALCATHKPVAIIVRYGKINAKVMDACGGNLQVISKHGSGIDVIDQKAAAERGIAVRAAVGANAAAVAEHTWALILACANSVPQLDARMRAGHWDKSTHKSLELAGRTIGLVGLGAIGRRVAAVAVAFDMNVLAYDPYAKEAPAGVTLVALDALFAASDIVSLHCPLTDENRQMINAEALGKFKRGAILVNTARGGLIDEPALADAIASGHLLAAGLDSFDVEPMSSPHVFQRLSNAILSPHIGGVSDAAYVNMGKGAAANVIDVIDSHARSAA